MNSNIEALYQIHRYQIILNARDHTGEYRFPNSFLYAVVNDIYPTFDQTWHSGEEDPFLECYTVTKPFIEDVLKYVDDLWVKKEPIPSFYEIEEKYGREHRSDLIRIFRYTFLNHGFDEPFYKALLAPQQHPTEAGSLDRPFSDDELMLL